MDTSVFVCPDCGSGLEHSKDRLICKPCGGSFPILHGIARLLPSYLLHELAKAYPEAEINGHSDKGSLTRAEKITLKTLRNYGFHHNVLTTQSVVEESSNQWMAQFQEFSAVEPGYFKGKVGLDLGCGGGRFTYCAHELGATVYGMDLSLGVERAARTNAGNSRARFVQADIYHPCFVPKLFDFIFSFGVIHHLPDIPAALKNVLSLLKPGGDLFVWVYALEDMAWYYRLSHLKHVRFLSQRVPRWAQIFLSTGIAATASAVIAGPYLVFRAKLPPQILKFSQSDFREKVATVFDRVAVPQSHYFSTRELDNLFRAQGLENVCITTNFKNGLRAIGTKPGGRALPQSA